jgi:hypothetical protein
MWLNLFWITMGFLTLFSMVICYAGCVAAKRADHSLRIDSYAEQLNRDEQTMPYTTFHEATFTNRPL